MRPCLVIALLGAFFLVAACEDPQDDKVPVDYRDAFLPEMEGLFNEYQKLQDFGSYGALGDTLRRANKDLQASELFVQAAFAYWEAGDMAAATTMLHRAIDRGMSNPKILEKFPETDQEPAGDSWDQLLGRLDSIQTQLRKPANFELKTASMEAFWPHFERAMKDTSEARRHLKAFIFEGPPEVRDFYVVRYGSIDHMYGQMVNASPNYYRYLKTRFQPDSLKVFCNTILESMKRFQELYPGAVFPKVYIVPGILNSGGTATEMGMFLGGDMYGRSPEMPVDDLTDWQEGAIMEFSDLPRLTMHELMHFQQNYRDKTHDETLLSAVIQEGVCDFMVELCSGEPMENENLAFLSDPANEAWIFGEFREELMGDDTSKWLYNGGSIEDRPHDLGYTLGYLISKSYYQQSPDKKKAVNELLNTDDFLKIVKDSEYAYLLDEAI
ncbi:MAG: DUF2268 domain-containing putative Zn-dependent protease [Robiginitalea sp.]|nr:DUF2268 domain-containing putative Zn-dependent protease [Robiginitalea sp.]